MTNKVKRRDFPSIFNWQFIYTASLLVQVDSSVYWWAGNLQGSLFFFFLCMVGDTQMRKTLKKYGIFRLSGIGVKWKYYIQGSQVGTLQPFGPKDLISSVGRYTGALLYKK